MTTDTFVIRTVVLGLAGAVIVAIAGGVYLAATKNAIPDFLVAMGTGAMGALAAVLARTSSEQPVVTAERADIDVAPTKRNR